MLEAAVQSRHHLTTSFVPLDQHNYFVSRARSAFEHESNYQTLTSNASTHQLFDVTISTSVTSDSMSQPHNLLPVIPVTNTNRSSFRIADILSDELVRPPAGKADAAMIRNV